MSKKQQQNQDQGRSEASNLNQDEEQQRNQRDQQGSQAGLDVDNEDLQNDEGSNKAKKASQKPGR